jgi:hypothetical protein
LATLLIIQRAYGKRFAADKNIWFIVINFGMRCNMEGIEAVQGQNNILEAWQNAQNVQLELATAIMKQGQEMAEMEGEAVLKLLDSMPRMDGTGQLIQKSA